jgi:beta-glucosidase
VAAGGKAVDITLGLSVAEGKGWREMVLTPACLGSAGGKLTFASTAPFAFQISEITRDEAAAGAECSF